MRVRRNLLLTVLLFAGFLAGAVFIRFWHLARPPPDQALLVSAVMMAKLDDMRKRPKYVDEPGTIYNGMRPEIARRLAEAQLNTLIDRLRQQIAATPNKKFVLREFSKTLAQFEQIDTEDRERLCGYLEEIMDILGIESSDGLLNRWMYGPLLGTILQKDVERTKKPASQD